MSIDTVLLRKSPAEFSFPDNHTFCVAGILFRIDDDGDSSLFGPHVRLWADGVMIFKDRKIKVVGGLGTQVHNTYSPIEDLRERVAHIRRDHQKRVQKAKLADVCSLLGAPTT